MTDAPSLRDTDLRVRAEQIRILSRQLPITASTGTAVALLATLGAWRGAGGKALGIWAVAYVIVALIRVCILPFYHRDPQADRRARRWGDLFMIDFGVSGLMWLIFGLITANPADPRHTMFVSIVLAGMTAASLASLSSFRPAHLAFALPAMMGFIVPNAISGVSNGVIMAMMAVIYLVVNVLGGLSAERALISSIRLRFDNDRLIEELRERHERAQQLAFHDALTQLPNRILLADRLQQSVARVARRSSLVAVCYLDLDGFKQVNDQHGHEAGDRLLIEMARRLQSTARSNDTVARLGGDEFVIVLNDLNSTTECDTMLNRVLEIVAEPVILAPGVSARVSTSVGVSFCPDDGTDPDALLRQADRAMYQAKQAGRNRIYSFLALGTGVQFEPRNDRERIRDALDKRQFVLHWQPKADIRQGVVIGAEALIRWPQADGTVMLPGEFLPAIEDDPLIVGIGDWVMDEALATLSRWQGAGLGIKVAVNVAARQLLDPDFILKLERMAARHSAEIDGHLEMEVLETVALRDLNRVNNVMQDCRRLGVDFALDDFGTGYSSITYFRRLPAKTVKIDQSFVRDMLDDHEDRAIVESILGMTAAFDKKVVAEGVEKPEHGATLLKLGCDIVQGYALARPMPESDFRTWLADFKPDPIWQTG